MYYKYSQSPHTAAWYSWVNTESAKFLHDGYSATHINPPHLLLFNFNNKQINSNGCNTYLSNSDTDYTSAFTVSYMSTYNY